MRKRVLRVQSHKHIREQTMESDFIRTNGQQTKENTPNEDTFSSAINRKLTDFMKKTKIKGLMQKIKAQRGRNNAIKYQDQFQFKEQWQLIDKSNDNLHYNYLFPQKILLRILNGIMLFLFTFLIWLLSIFRLFQYRDTLQVFTYSLVVNILDLLLKGFCIYGFLSDDKIKNENKKIQKMDLVEKFTGNFFIGLYSILGMTHVISDVDNDIYLILDFACIYLVYLRCEQIYNNFKILMVCSKYKAYMKIYDLMSNLFLLIHLFSILIYAVSRLHPSQTYLTIVQVKNPLNWFDKYIYSIYFSSTTMLTVGYGDLLPSNIQEIAVVLIMQLFGIVMIGYINGEVGDVLCTLRKERQSLENDLTNSQKLCKSYKLNHQASQKIREYLINNRKLDEELNIQEENKLLSKMSDQLRLQANYTYHINIIKDSLLFVYNFSKKIQIQVSYKLNKVVFSPNETLPQIMGKEKIYLLSKGQLALYVAKRNKKVKNTKKISRVLSKNDNSNGFNQNSFGHTALILGRPTELKAFAMDFAICHTIQRHDLLEALHMDSNDLERFHEMRATYEICKHPQKQECPEFYSIREHYAPNIQFVIKRYLKHNNFTGRREWIRDRERSRMIFQDFDENSMYEEECESEDTESSASSVVDPNKIREEKVLNSIERQNKYKMASSDNLPVKIRTRGYESKYMNKKYEEKKEELVKKFHFTKFEEPFEVVKQYGLFFKHANVSHVLKKYMFQKSIIQIATPFLEILPTFYDANSSSAQIFRQRSTLKSMPY